MDQWVFIPSSCGIKHMERHCFKTSSSNDGSMEGNTHSWDQWERLKVGLCESSRCSCCLVQYLRLVHKFWLPFPLKDS